MINPSIVGDANEPVLVEDDRTGMHPVTLERAVLDHLYYTCARDHHTANIQDIYRSVAHAVRDRLVQRWVATKRTYYDRDVKRVYYLSAEFLLGRQLTQNLNSLGLFDTCRRMLEKHGIKLDHVLDQEPDPGLGNGGLGRLAACFLDSMATLGIPGLGYGIRYEFGIFEQQIHDGWQVERADAWLQQGYPWEFPRHDYTTQVRFYGHVEEGTDEAGNYRPRWVDTTHVLGVPYDTLVPGYGNHTVNTLRLWSARASQQLNLDVFNAGDYRRAVEEKSFSESISKVLYPADESPEGRELRLKQQYFFVACSLHDIINRHKKRHATLDNLADKAALQLNDTHPAIAVAELMRLLIDKEDMHWDRAWDITQRSIAYTNHTLLPEALERWPEPMFGRLLPRHLQIIREINHRFLRRVEIHRPNEADLKARMSIVEEGPVKHIRMANLAVVGSHSVNGVAQLHSDLVRSELFSDFAGMFPERFNNKTNGVTPRRWILAVNPQLSAAITARIGPGWITELGQLEQLAPLADDADFRRELRDIKLANKQRLAHVFERQLQLEVDPESLFDVQIKRIHEYKRQLLDCLHVIALYLRARRDPTSLTVPRTFIFGGKAAPGYAIAKLHIKLINDVARTVNHDADLRGRIKVVFVPNYSVTAAERILPAADLSEQISTAGMEASGTGNMKFAMNGALTIGTLDGANIEIRERVGADNFFLFGLDAAQVVALKRDRYQPRDYIARSPALGEVLDVIASGFFSPDDPGRFHSIVAKLYDKDPFFVCADFDAYAEAQSRVSEAYLDPDGWWTKVVRNIAHMGDFSSDRTIREYASDIWHAPAVVVGPLRPSTYDDRRPRPEPA